MSGDRARWERFRGTAKWAPLLVLLAFGIGACASQTFVRTVTQSAASSSVPEPTGTTPPATGTAANNAKVGDSLTLSGQDGEQLAVKVDAVMDPLQVGEFDQPDSGQRYVGIQITLRNTGSVPYSDSPSNGATLLSNTAEQASTEIVDGGPCQSDFASDVKIAPGGTQQGCIPFEMPTGQSPHSFQFTLDSGFGDDTGQWSLAGAPTASAQASAQASGTANNVATSSQPSSGTDDPTSVVDEYWTDIQAHDFAGAYGLFVPGAIAGSEAAFTANETKAGISQADFSGHVSSQSSSSATVSIDSLTTRDQQYGCQSWSGGYSLEMVSGAWRISRANITPTGC